VKHESKSQHKQSALNKLAHCPKQAPIYGQRIYLLLTLVQPSYQTHRHHLRVQRSQQSLPADTLLSGPACSSTMPALVTAPGVPSQPTSSSNGLTV